MDGRPTRWPIRPTSLTQRFPCGGSRGAIGQIQTAVLDGRMHKASLVAPAAIRRTRCRHRYATTPCRCVRMDLETVIAHPTAHIPLLVEFNGIHEVDGLGINVPIAGFRPIANI